MKQALIILSCIVLGVLFPQGASLAFLIRYVLMVLLFFAFLEIKFDRGLFQPLHFVVLGLNLVLPLGFYYATRFLWNEPFAYAAFIIAVAPTGAVAPVMAQLLRVRIAPVVASVLLTTPAVALLLPFVVPLMGEGAVELSVGPVLWSTATLVGIPLAVVGLLRLFVSRHIGTISKLRRLSPYLFAFNVWVASGKATEYLTAQTLLGATELLGLLLLIGAVAVVSFGAGWLLNRDLRYENSLNLGRKNTMFALWFALAFLHPVAALGPMFYILWQNLINSLQIAYRTRKLRIPA